MDYGHAREILKGKKHCHQPQRFRQVSGATFKWEDGEGGSYTLYAKGDGSWQCNCLCARHSLYPCGHVRALEELINDGQIQQLTMGQIDDLAYSVGPFDWDLYDHPVLADTARTFLDEVVYWAESWREELPSHCAG